MNAQIVGRCMLAATFIHTKTIKYKKFKYINTLSTLPPASTISLLPVGSAYFGSARLQWGQGSERRGGSLCTTLVYLVFWMPLHYCQWYCCLNAPIIWQMHVRKYHRHLLKRCCKANKKVNSSKISHECTAIIYVCTQKQNTLLGFAV